MSTTNAGFTQEELEQKRQQYQKSQKRREFLTTAGMVALTVAFPFLKVLSVVVALAFFALAFLPALLGLIVGIGGVQQWNQHGFSIFAAACAVLGFSSAFGWIVRYVRSFREAKAEG